MVRVGFVGGTITSRDYMLQDHLGSSSARVDSSGTVTWRESYTPFGETLNNPAGNADNPGHCRGLLRLQSIHRID